MYVRATLIFLTRSRQFIFDDDIGSVTDLILAHFLDRIMRENVEVLFNTLLQLNYPIINQKLVADNCLTKVQF